MAATTCETTQQHTTAANGHHAAARTFQSLRGVRCDGQHEEGEQVPQRGDEGRGNVVRVELESDRGEDEEAGKHAENQARDAGGYDGRCEEQGGVVPGRMDKGEWQGCVCEREWRGVGDSETAIFCAAQVKLVVQDDAEDNGDEGGQCAHNDGLDLN